MKFAGLFDPVSKSMDKMWGMNIAIDTTPAKEVLGINFTPIRSSVHDMCETLIATDYILPPGSYGKKGCCK